MKVWHTVPVDAASAQALASDLGVLLPIATLLVARGFTTTEAARSFLEPRLASLGDPFALPNMPAAAQRVWRAVIDGEPIVVYGDYDVDGVTSTCLLVDVLRLLGGNVKAYLPHRMDDGYGLSVDALATCVERDHPKLIISVDCGTGSIEAVAEANRLGIDVIVTDHHEPSDGVADALAVVNPKLGNNEDNKRLAGVGVAFKLCHALIKSGREHCPERVDGIDLKDFLDLVAVGTIADSAMLRGENRILASSGLACLNRTGRLGLQALVEVAQIQSRMDHYHVGYALGPRLNAAGRLGTAQAALDLLLSEDYSTALALARELDEANQERRTIEAELVEQCMAQIEIEYNPEETYALVVGGSGWHLGVIGIAASRLCDRYQRPAVVISFDEKGLGRGSCRSIHGFDLVDGLGKCSKYLDRYGGHTMAAGLGIAKDQFDAFKREFNQLAKDCLQGEDLRPEQRIDAWVDCRDITDDLVAAIDQCKPFGVGNPGPVWALDNAVVVGRPWVVGNGHLKMTIAKGGMQWDSIGFGLGDLEVPEGPLKVAFQLRMNSYRGRERLQMHVLDFKAANDPSAAG